MKTSELTGATLSYAVTMIEMPHLVWGKTIGVHHASKQVVVPELSSPDCYSPFSGWEMCGPIIEREQISVEHDFANGEWAAWAPAPRRDDSDAFGYGNTPLIAAMRCYVASRLGDEVDVPEELK